MRMVFRTANGRRDVTITERRSNWAGYWLRDIEYCTWRRRPEWDRDGKFSFAIPDSTKGWDILLTRAELDEIESI